MSEDSQFYKHKSASTETELHCTNCGNQLKFEPGEESLVCDNCNTVNSVSNSDETIRSNDYISAIELLEEESTNKIQVHTIHCNSCGANTTLKQNETSAECPYCDGSLIVSQQETYNALKPEYILPFKIENTKAQELYKKWVNGLWWAPNKIKKLSNKEEKLEGIYYPYWTFDTDTNSDYTGQCGNNYNETRTYRDSQGNIQTKNVTKTNWSLASGEVYDSFKDILIVASKSLSTKHVKDLEPWDLKNLKTHNDQYLSGFRTETYFTDLKEGFEIAKKIIDKKIKAFVKQDIGGDKQRIFTLNTSYNDIKFKHILLPIWISSFKYKNKTYQFVINARSGEVQGERPYSWEKITLVILGVIVIIGAIFFLI